MNALKAVADIPTEVADHLAPDSGVVLHTENLLTRDGKPVSRVHTDLATFLITENGVVVHDLHGIELADLQSLLDVPLTKELS